MRVNAFGRSQLRKVQSVMTNRSDRDPPSLETTSDYQSVRQMRRGSADSIGASRFDLQEGRI